MIATTVGEIAALTGGRLDGVSADVVVDGPIVVDSRRCVPGSAFVCVAGQHDDGHRFAADARRRGAAVALAQERVDAPAIVVDDTVAALGRLAAGVLRRAHNCRVVGVTGSSGKTSTKDLIAAVLSPQAATVAAAGSFNNEIGLPLTVLGIEANTRFLVLEYSARGPGHIAYLCGVARPDVAVVLNVGTAHLGEFGSREAVAAAKGELVEAVAPDGVAVLGVDDSMVSRMRSRTTASVLGFGVSEDADVRIADLTLTSDARPAFRLETAAGSIDVRLQISGAHQALNAAAAAAAAIALDVPLGEISARLAAVSEVSAHRMQVRRRADGLVVVDDAYNANPESMVAALDALAAVARERSGRSWAVLGEMRELGADSEELHRVVGRHAAALGIDRVVTVGADSAAIGVGAASDPDWTGALDEVADADAAIVLLRSAIAASDVVLVKASNALALWRVATAVLATEERGHSNVGVPA
ncbi:MAG TPA: UDP-N-acetylmuramoyl-tripeptide--D-alanyl-D-alanine ligase [Mycobacteriales bacterium]|nr:UDP-N-acetylmuramoyl-tripeptide--D-alanyl-D-alanine ligase [Mycobacteriales bacterium]